MITLTATNQGEYSHSNLYSDAQSINGAQGGDGSLRQCVPRIKPCSKSDSPRNGGEHTQNPRADGVSRPGANGALPGAGLFGKA